MNKIKIPKRFRLFGQTIEVIFESKLGELDDAKGMALYRESRIKIQSKSNDNCITDEMIEETFLHELVHWILYKIGEDKLRNSEKLVSEISQLLHQAFQTMEY